MSNNDQWGFNLSEMKISNNVKEPLGFNFLASNENDNAKAKRKEQNQMKINKAWDLVIGQGKGIFMTFISTFFIGSNISLFTIFIYGFYAFNTFTAIFNVNKAYKMLESPEYSLFNYKLGYVSQKPIIFNGTVNFNISFGKKISDKKIKEAARIAKANEFIEKMEDNYSSHIASSGTNISGGQKQRISIARAIAKDPEIYIFDDAFSALDYKTDFELRKGLKKYTKDATVLIVAQRIGTIMNADKIIVLDDGKCVGVGTHKELLKTCKIYKNIALSQLSEEELS